MMKIFMRQTEAISPAGSPPNMRVVYVPTIYSTFGFHLRRHHHHCVCVFGELVLEKSPIPEIPLAGSIAHQPKRTRALKPGKSAFNCHANAELKAES